MNFGDHGAAQFGQKRKKPPPYVSPNDRAGAAINGSPSYNNDPIKGLAVSSGRLSDLSNRIRKTKKKK